MKKLAGIAVFAGFALAVWSCSPVAAIGANALLRPDYQMRDFSSEYVARLRPNRVYWRDYTAYRLDCVNGEMRRVVLLHTGEFDETPAEFIARAYPQCTGWTKEGDDRLPAGISGALVGRR